MVSNKIKIEPTENKILYYFYEGDQWIYISDYRMPLSREEYTKANIRDDAKKILARIDEDYNITGGVEIYFSGSADDYDYFCEVAAKYFPDIKCEMQAGSDTEIVVLGGPDSGANELIDALIGDNEFSKTTNKSFEVFQDKTDGIKYYFLNKRLSNEANTQDLLNKLFDWVLHQNIETIIYCVPENNYYRETISTLLEKGIKVVIVLTNPSKESRADVRKNLNSEFQDTNLNIVTFPRNLTVFEENQKKEEHLKGNTETKDKTKTKAAAKKGAVAAKVAIQAATIAVNNNIEGDPLFTDPSLTQESNDIVENKDPVIRALRLDRVAAYIYGLSFNLIIMSSDTIGGELICETILGKTAFKECRESRKYVYNKSLPLPLLKQETESDKSKIKNTRMTIFETETCDIEEMPTTEYVLGEVQDYYFYSEEKQPMSDINVIWLCDYDEGYGISERTQKTVGEISDRYDIPIIIISFYMENQKEKIYELGTEDSFLNAPIIRIMLSRDENRNLVIQDDDVMNGLYFTVSNYGEIYADFLINKDNKKIKELQEENKNIPQVVQRKLDACEQCVKKYEAKAMAEALVPGMGATLVNNLYMSMVHELNEIAGVHADMNLALDFINFIVRTKVTPITMIPVLGSVTSRAYISVIGKQYVTALSNVLCQSSEQELENNELMRKRILDELNKIEKANT